MYLLGKLQVFSRISFQQDLRPRKMRFQKKAWGPPVSHTYSCTFSFKIFSHLSLLRMSALSILRPKPAPEGYFNSNGFYFPVTVYLGREPISEATEKKVPSWISCSSQNIQITSSRKPLPREDNWVTWDWPHWQRWGLRAALSCTTFPAGRGKINCFQNELRSFETLKPMVLEEIDKSLGFLQVGTDHVLKISAVLKSLRQ